MGFYKLNPMPNRHIAARVINAAPGFSEDSNKTVKETANQIIR